jgi:hypothetical protein
MVAAACCALAMYYHDQLDWKVGCACSGYQLFELKELMSRLHVFFNGMKVASDKLHSCRCNDEKGIGHNEDVKKLFGDVLKRPVCNLLYITWDEPLALVKKYHDIVVSTVP